MTGARITRQAAPRMTPAEVEQTLGGQTLGQSARRLSSLDVLHGLAIDRDGVDLHIQQTLTSAAKTGVQKPAGVPNSVFDAGKLARPPKRKFEPLPVLAALVIEQGVPVPVAGVRGSRQVYGELLAAMQPGQSVVLSQHQATNLRAMAPKCGARVTVRHLPEGKARVWRLADAPQNGTGDAA